MMPLRAALCLLALACAIAPAATFAAPPTAPVQLSQSVIRLYGPWRFTTGDDPRWADSNFDDSRWREMDLTPPLGANDGDVGLEGFAPGWNARGYPGYHGFAWYRMRVDVRAPNAQSLALLGPWAVDSAYQVYVDGRLLGGVGNFSGSTPLAFGYHYPRHFELPGDIAHGGTATIAIRVWAGPWVSGPLSGGVHIAPTLGETQAILALYRLEEFKIFEGYIVDAIPATIFVLTMIVTLCLLPLTRNKVAYAWLAAALFFSAVQRGNQAFFFWLEIETIQQFVVIVIAIAGTLVIASWLMTWRAWLDVERPKWLPWVIAAFAILLIAAEIFAHPWLFANPMPQAVPSISRDLISWTRIALLLTLVWIVYLGLRRDWREVAIALPAILAMTCFVFSTELSALHVPGIWFPWGVGLSLSECASVATCVLVTCLLLRRLWFRPRNPRPLPD